MPDMHTSRIAIITSTISRLAGGLFWSVKDLSKSLLSLDIHLKLFAGEDKYSTQDLNTWGSVPISVFPIIGPSAFGFQYGLQKALKDYQPDLLHVQGIWMYTSYAATKWYAEYQKPNVISPRGMLDPWALRNSAWKKRIAGAFYENYHLKSAGCIHALCDAERDAVRKFGLKNPIAIIPNGVNLPDLTTLAFQPSWDAILPSGAKTLLFLGRIHPKKGLIHLFKAWSLAMKRNTLGMESWYLVIAGWDQGGHRDELVRLAYELQIEDRIHFIGSQFGDAKTETFRRADAFVLPSFSEGLPMSVLEAWSYELPVIFTPQCNLPEGSAAGAAILVDAEVKSLAEGLAKLFAMSAEELILMGKNGRLLVKEKFNWEVIGENMKNTYDWLLTGSNEPNFIDR